MNDALDDAIGALAHAPTPAALDARMDGLGRQIAAGDFARRTAAPTGLTIAAALIAGLTGLVAAGPLAQPATARTSMLDGQLALAPSTLLDGDR